MIRKLASSASIVVLVGLLPPLAMAQSDEIYDFDGVADEDPQPADPTDWMTSENWGKNDGFDPISPLLPDFGTRVEIDESKYGANAPVIGPGDVAEAFGVRIGRGSGEGLLTMTEGTLDLVDHCSLPPSTCDSRLRVGAANVTDPAFRHPGTFNLSGGTVTTDTLWIGSGSHGEMNMSGGEVNTRGNFYLDWTFDAGSHFSMTGGVVNVGTDLRMHRNSSLHLDGGTMLISGAAGLGWADSVVAQTPNVTVNLSSGLLESASFLRVEGSVVVDGGILRANSFEDTLSTGTVEINGDGILQFNNAQESVAGVEALSSSGACTTSEALPLTVTIVDVGGTDFTTVAVVPEPSSVVLVLLASITMFSRYRSL